MNVSAMQTIPETRSVPLILLVLATAQSGASYGQSMVSPAFAKDQPVNAAKAEPDRKVITIRAAEEPDPAMRYRFWPAAEVRRQGNPMPFVSRAILLSVQSRQAPGAMNEYNETYEALAELPIEQLPGDKVRDFLAKYAASALGDLARAENLMSLEYDLRMDELATSELVATLLPELQEMRSLARLLQLRARLAIAERRWDDMVDDLRLGFRLAEFAGNANDLLIGRLVGYAISATMMEVVEAAIQRPGCPNLYWALAALPESRLHEIRDAIEFESALVTRMLRDLGRLPASPIGADAAREKLRALVRGARKTMMVGGSDLDDAASADLLAGFLVVTLAEPSRELLAGTTAWGQRAETLSTAEAVLRAAELRIHRVRDNWFKWALLPDGLWDQYKSESESALKDIGGTDVIESFVHQLTPSVDAARRASRRGSQTKNLLLTIEAIRMHVAVTGRLPESIEALHPVPAWQDSVALEPFDYRCNSPTSATLQRAPRWPGDPETNIQLSLAKEESE